MAVMVAVMVSLAGTAPSLAQAGTTPPVDGPGALISFVTQTPWVNADGEFLVAFRVGPPTGESRGDVVGGGEQVDATAFEVNVTVFPSVASRTAFAESLAGRGLRAPLGPSVRSTLSDIPRESDGSRVVRVPAPPTRRNGVHPVRVELRDRATGAVVDRFITHLVYIPEPNVGPRLAVSLVLPVHLPPHLGPDGNRRVVQADVVGPVASAFQSVAAIPVTLVPTPETVAALVASGGDAGGLLTTLRQIAAQRRIVGGPYVPLNLPTALASGMSVEFGAQMARGAEALVETLRAAPDLTTWAADEPLDAASVDVLAGRGVQRVVAADSALTPTGDRLLTLTRPFSLEGESASVPAVAADPGLGSYFTDTANPALAAAHLLGDLAVLHFDQPGDRRGAVAMPPRSWTPSRPFIDLVVAGLANNPVLEPVEVHTLFATVTPESVSGSKPLVRRPVVSPVTPRPELGRELASARRRLASLDLVLGEGSLVSSQLGERLLVAQSADLAGARQRDPYLSGVRRAIDGQFDGIEMPQDRSITLTARRGEIPVTFRNRTGHPVKLAVRLESDKLVFPRGERESLDLTRLNTTQRFPVVARTSGAFPIRIILESPDGQLRAGEATLTVRSTAAPGLGVGISLGAALFLAIWWGRNLSRGSRGQPKRRAGDDAAYGPSPEPPDEGNAAPASSLPAPEEERPEWTG